MSKDKTYSGKDFPQYWNIPVLREEYENKEKDAVKYLNEKHSNEYLDRVKAIFYERLDPLREPKLLPSSDPLEAYVNNNYHNKETALLSSSDILAYHHAVSLLNPFDDKYLKSSSYQINLGGTVIFWDEDGTRMEFEIKSGEKLRLPANSIVFVQVETYFQLPLYIAVRFNLKITHVHRGLLLGTGPLVDPGFRGRLFVPLHNLTSSDYWIDTKEGLIWAEFTRTSFDLEKDKAIRKALSNNFKGLENKTEFPTRKKELKPNEYLRKANGREPIRSSIPVGIKKSQNAAESAKKQVQQLTLATFLALAVGTAAFLGALYSAVGLADEGPEIEKLRDEIRRIEKIIDDQKES